MPELSDYQVLSLVGLEIDDVSRRSERLTANFGGGYGATALVGSPGGLHTWRLSSGALPDDASYGYLINGLPRFEYYWEFFTTHTTTRDVFEIEFRGKRYHASFVQDEQTASMYSIDLFSMEGVEIRQRKVKGIRYWSDGSIFDLDSLPGMFSWHTPDGFPGPFGLAWSNSLTNGNQPLSDFGADGDVIAVPDEQNGLQVTRFNSVSGGGFLYGPENPTIYEAMFVMKVNEAAFSSGAGLITNDVGVPFVFGSNGNTKWNNNSLGSNYEYRFNNVVKLESNQTAPMNVWGVVHARYNGGITLSNLQIGKRTDATGTLLKADIGEILLSEAAWTDAQINDLYNYLVSKWGL
jgi:hypothetical protein